MSKTPDGRSRTRLATRQSISNAATLLFMERGFDQVTIDEIAQVAGVGRVTVFNHFARKEDLFFDLDKPGRDVLLEALRRRDAFTSPIEALRELARQLVAERSPFVDFSEMSQRYVETIQGSETLKARARAIRDELASVVADALSKRAGRAVPEPSAKLAAALLLATWSVAFSQAHQTFRETRDVDQANAAFLAIVDQGTVGLNAAMAGTAYD